MRTEAVLLTALFGVGKSTIAAEMADHLEDAGVPFDFVALSDRSSAHLYIVNQLMSLQDKIHN